jgi:hypothetical protein
MTALILPGLVAWGVTNSQLGSADKMARNDRLAEHVAALEGFRQSLRTLGDVLDDQTETGSDAAGEATEDIAAALASVQSFALEVRATANAGDLRDADAIEECDEDLRRSADALMAIRTTGPLSWQSVNDGYVADGAPRHVQGTEGDVDNIDAQIDFLLKAVKSEIDGIKSLIKDEDSPSVDCPALFPSPVE